MLVNRHFASIEELEDAQADLISAATDMRQPASILGQNRVDALSKQSPICFSWELVIMLASNGLKNAGPENRTVIF